MPFVRAEIQKAMVTIGPQTAMGPHIGWKAGGTNAAAQKTLGLSGPFRERSALFFAADARSLTEAAGGPLFESGLTQSPASLSKSRYNLNLLEPEFGFKLKADLPNPCTAEQVRALLPLPPA